VPDPSIAEGPRLARQPILSVLIVDDEALIRWSLRRALKNRGHEVTEAADAAQALAALRDHEGAFDVVLLDYRLPDCHDASLLALVRQQAPATAVFMMTAYGDDAMRSSSRTLGARAIVDKPFQLDTFVAMVEAAGEQPS
jgi:DNA-binding NtrC family response regulator